MQILLVDDKNNVIEQLTHLLAQYQCSIDCAGNGLDALEKAQSKQYDLFIVDHLMPVMNGIQLVKNLHSKHLIDVASVIFMTTQNTNSLKSLPENSLFTHVMAKPIDVENFYQIIEKLFPQNTPLRSISN